MKWHCETRGVLANHNYPNRPGINLSEIDNPISYILNTPEVNAQITKMVKEALWDQKCP